MDWNYPIRKYFDLPPEKREEYIVGLSKFYYNKWVSTENQQIYEFTLLDALETFRKHRKAAILKEDYEQADIFLKLERIFDELLYKNIEE